MANNGQNRRVLLTMGSAGDVHAVARKCSTHDQQQFPHAQRAETALVPHYSAGPPLSPLGGGRGGAVGG